MKHLLLIAVLTGCVVPYGETPETSVVETAQASTAMGDLTGLEARLLLLMDENQDADRAARLEALRSLLRRSRTWEPRAQQDLVVYVRSLLQVEERWRSDQGLEGFGPIAPVSPADAPIEEFIEGSAVAVPVVEETLGDDTDTRPPAELPVVDDPDTVTPDRSAEAMREEGLQAAREALSKGAYLEAIEQLDALQADTAGGDDEPDEQLATLRSEAVDGWVHTERERAGRLFLEAREISDAEARSEALSEVVAILEGLLGDYPESSYAEAINRNLQLVKRELGDG